VWLFVCGVLLVVLCVSPDSLVTDGSYILSTRAHTQRELTRECGCSP